MSGLGYTRLTLKDLDDKPERREKVKEIFDILNSETNHKFGYLFNAFTEEKFGERLSEYRPHVHSVHCDSGGLQVITRGMNITPEMKRDIYKTQAKYCDVAMSFDEIPVTTVGEASSRNDTTNRFFDHAKFEECAIQTGKNIFEQIQAFEEYKTTAKPLLIAQGNCAETYQEWVEIILKQIPKQYHHQIGGVAMGGAALGTGSLEDVIRAFMFANLPIDAKHLHILGVGSAIRLVPYLIFANNGVYKDISISYDSTTHSSAMVFGRYYSKDGWIKFPNKHEDKVLHPMIYRETVEKFGLDLTYEDMLNIMENANAQYAEKTGKCKSDVVMFMFAISAAMVLNFMKQIDVMASSKEELMSFISQYEEPAIFNSLYGVKTLEDYKHWETHAGRFVKSMRIAKEKSSDLSSFF